MPYRPQGILTSPASDRDIRPGIVCGQVCHLETAIVGYRLHMRDEWCLITAGRRRTRLEASAASHPQLSKPALTQRSRQERIRTRRNKNVGASRGDQPNGARSALLACFVVFSTFILFLCVKRLVTFDRQRGRVTGRINRPTQTGVRLASHSAPGSDFAGRSHKSPCYPQRGGYSSQAPEICRVSSADRFGAVDRPPSTRLVAGRGLPKSSRGQVCRPANLI